MGQGTFPTTFTFTARKVVVPWTMRVLSILRRVWILATSQNPFIWRWWLGRRNPRADVEGPFYLIGAPSRQLDEGKAVLASANQLQEHGGFLVKVRVRGSNGELVKHATVDWWQADAAGEYAFSAYSLRGKFQTDAYAAAEVLTVPPGRYGPRNHLRAGHFHVIVSDPSGRWRPLTTQMYVCRANDHKELAGDLVNFIRPPRTDNMLQSWSLGREKFMDLPCLSSDDAETADTLAWWVSKLSSLNVDAKIIAGAQTEVMLNT